MLLGDQFPFSQVHISHLEVFGCHAKELRRGLFAAKRHGDISLQSRRDRGNRRRGELVAQSFGIDLVHLGVVITANLAIALYTPPVGGTLFVAAKLAGAGIGEITRALYPLLIAAVVVLFIITYVPSMTSVIWKHFL